MLGSKKSGRAHGPGVGFIGVNYLLIRHVRKVDLEGSIVMDVCEYDVVPLLINTIIERLLLSALVTQCVPSAMKIFSRM